MSDVSVGVAYLDIIPKLADGFDSKLKGAFSKQTDSITKKAIVGTAKVGAALTASVTVPLVALGKAAIKGFEQYDQALNQFSVSTGIHGKKLQKAGAEMKKIFSNETFASFDYTAIEDAMAKVTQRFDVTGGAAGKMTKKFLALSKVTGEAAPALIDGTSKAFAAFNVPAKRTGDLIDFIWKTSQKIGTPFSELTAGALGSQVALQAMGLSLKQGIALIGNLTDAGVASPTGALKGVGTYVQKLLNPTSLGKLQSVAVTKQKAVDAILARSGSASLSQQRRVADILARAKNGKLSQADQIALSRARADYGTGSAKDQADLKAAQFALDVARGDVTRLRTAQQDPHGALAAVFKEIKNAPTHDKALGLAAKAFGGRAGGALVNPIRRGQLDTKEFIKSIDSQKGGVGTDAKQLVTFSDSMESFKRKISNALIPLGRVITDVFKSMKPQIASFTKFIKDLSKRFADLSPGVKKFVVVVGLIAAAAGPTLIALAGLAAAIASVSASVLIASGGIGLLLAGFTWLLVKKGPLVAALAALGVAVLAFGLSLGSIAFTVGTLELPLIAVAAVVLALGAAFVWVAKHTKLIGHAFGAVKVVVGKVISFLINGLIWLVKKFKTVVDGLLGMASHLPFVGGKFADLKKKFDSFSNGMIGGLKNQQHRFGSWKNDVTGAINDVTGVINGFLHVTMKDWNNIMGGAGGGAQAFKGEGGLSIDRRNTGSQYMTQKQRRYYDTHNLDASGNPLKHHAAGGWADAGEWSMVGERGPELALFGRGAQIVPNHQLKGMGGGQTTNHFHIKSHDPHGVAREVHKIMNKDGERQGNHDKWSNRKFVG